MRHQNGRSRAAVASSLLSRLAFSHTALPKTTVLVFLISSPVLLTRPALCVVYGALTHMFPCLEISIANGEFGRDGRRQRHG